MSEEGRSVAIEGDRYTDEVGSRVETDERECLVDTCFNSLVAVY